MDDRTAYSILKIRAGTSLVDISRRHDHFIKLYKKYLMGETINISPEEIEQMKLAYECLLYKKIEEDELKDLYPQENTSLSHQMWRDGVKIARPFVHRQKAKIIYTLVMCVITYATVFIMNYKPIDLRVAVYSLPSESILEFEIRKQMIRAYEDQILINLPEIQNPYVEYLYCYPTDGLSSLLRLYSSTDFDVYIMDEPSLKEFKEAGIKFLALDKLVNEDTQQAYDPIQQGTLPIFEVYINKDTALYNNICNLQNNDESWVAVVSPNSRNKEQALRYIKWSQGDGSPDSSIEESGEPSP